MPWVARALQAGALRGLATRLAAGGYRTMAVVNCILLADLNGLDQGVQVFLRVVDVRGNPNRAASK